VPATWSAMTDERAGGSQAIAGAGKEKRASASVVRRTAEGADPRIMESITETTAAPLLPEPEQFSLASSEPSVLWPCAGLSNYRRRADA
jgi:hypothetical protein